ncbi:MAG: ribonuclease H-like domain-containing protein [Lachnospiraceae bacterium]|nr:ribonuclease H-like domain-containing protein [Lachnospiraceae bacterium]
MLVCETLINEYKADFISLVSGLNKDSYSDEFMLFDIESSGLDSNSEFIWLIGCVFLRNDELFMLRYFSEDISDEKRLLEEFYLLMQAHPRLVHYNGDSFDIRFIKNRSSLYSDSYDAAFSGRDFFENTYSYDLYKHLKKFKNLLNFPGMKQKEMEVYCGYHRADKLSGADLINIYINYIAAVRIERARLKSSMSKENSEYIIAPYRPIPGSGLPLLGSVDIESAYNAMLLHNHDDLIGMLKLNRLLEFANFLQSPDDISVSTDGQRYTFTIGFPETVMEFLEKRNIIGKIRSSLPDNASFDNNTLSISFSSFEGRLKHFYSNYKDYYYIPSEDMAIHKSVSDFIDGSLKNKATPDNCYILHNGSFIIFPPIDIATAEKLGIMIFKEEYSARRTFLETSQLKNDNSHLQAIVAEYLKLFFKGR